MISSALTRLNIPVTHFRKSWMKNIIIIGSSLQYPVLVSNEITKTEKRIKVNTDNK